MLLLLLVLLLAAVAAAIELAVAVFNSWSRLLGNHPKWQTLQVGTVGWRCFACHNVVLQFDNLLNRWRAVQMPASKNPIFGKELNDRIWPTDVH